MTRPLTRSQLLALAATTDIVTGGRAFGLGRTAAYELARSGDFPCRVIKTGGVYRVITADLLRVLAIAPDSSDDTSPVSIPSTEQVDNGDGARAATQTPLAETHTSTV
jgi:hypothetical protein